MNEVRYDQLMEYFNNDERKVEEVIEKWGVAKLWLKFLEADIRYLAIEAFGVSLDDVTVKSLANRYDNGDYDRNLPYWVNIENLIQEYLNQSTSS